MKIIETTWNGIRFRSRTEARWAVLFDKAGISYDYEKEGVVLPSGPYLPDFWLRDLGVWLEVKGEEPTNRERDLCAELSAASGKRVILAVGAPRYAGILHTWKAGRADPIRYALAMDRRNAGQFWLFAEDAGFPLNAGRQDHDRYPGNYEPLRGAYEAAIAERFEARDERKPQRDW